MVCHTNKRRHVIPENAARHIRRRGTPRLYGGDKFPKSRGMFLTTVLIFPTTVLIATTTVLIPHDDRPRGDEVPAGGHHDRPRDGEVPGK